MKEGKKEEAENAKAEVVRNQNRVAELSENERVVEEELKKKMMVIPNIIDPSVPIGKDDSENREVEKYGEPVVPDFEIPYHTEIMDKLLDVDKELWKKEIAEMRRYYDEDIAAKGGRVPQALRDVLDKIEANLNK